MVQQCAFIIIIIIIIIIINYRKFTDHLKAGVFTVSSSSSSLLLLIIKVPGTFHGSALSVPSNPPPPTHHPTWHFTVALGELGNPIIA